ncbi:hypothetical protein BDV59DRAFT_187412 [Aspergillus ambiguus]|uniref:uncharacterized protein n=1 Tax=Aspergillus ambiguus TaxID=176160 RepID=UPI003CCE1915
MVNIVGISHQSHSAWKIWHPGRRPSHTIRRSCILKNTNYLPPINRIGNILLIRLTELHISMNHQKAF